MDELNKYLPLLSSPAIADTQRDTYILIYTIVPLATICVALRSYARYYIVLKFGLDDMLIVIAMFGNLFNIGLHLMQLTSGVGRPFSEVGFEKFRAILRCIYTHGITNLVTMGVIKLSYLAFYRRLSVDEKFQLTLKILAVILTLFTVSMTFLNIFYLCTPIAEFWNPHTFPDHCTNIIAIHGAQTLFAILSDMALLLLPLPGLLRLQVSVGRKLGLMFIFGIGAIATFASIYRVYTLVMFDMDSDKTLNGTSMMGSTIVESNLAIIAACFPGMKPIWRKMMSREPLRPVIMVQGVGAIDDRVSSTTSGTSYWLVDAQRETSGTGSMRSISSSGRRSRRSQRTSCIESDASSGEVRLGFGGDSSTESMSREGSRRFSSGSSGIADTERRHTYHIDRNEPVSLLRQSSSTYPGSSSGDNSSRKNDFPSPILPAPNLMSASSSGQGDLEIPILVPNALVSKPEPVIPIEEVNPHAAPPSSFGSSVHIVDLEIGGIRPRPGYAYEEGEGSKDTKEVEELFL